MPLVKVVEIRKGCRVREGWFRTFWVKFKVMASKWKVGKSCFIHSSGGSRRHGFGNRVIPSG
jgi:hypothetical protein